MSGPRAEIVLASSDAFPTPFQGRWENVDGVSAAWAEIEGRSLIWCGRPIEFGDIIATYEEDGSLAGLELKPRDPADVNFPRNDIFALCLTNDATQLWVGSTKEANVLTRVTDAQD